MTWVKGLNCRATSGYVTDGTDDTYILDDGSGLGEQYPITRNGFTFGYDSSTGVQTRDRNSGNDPRLAGTHSNTPDLATIRIDVPATGTYLARAAFGDAAYAAGDIYAEFQNGTTALATVDDSGGTSAPQRFDDATGVELTNVTWPGSNATVSLTLTGTIFRLAYGKVSGSRSCAVNHVSLDQQAAASNAQLVNSHRLIGGGQLVNNEALVG